MNRVGILVLTVSASLCLAVSVRGDPAGPARAGTEPTGTAGAQARPLSANDISWLFPAPASEADLAALISMGELAASDGPVWTEDVFHHFLAIAGGPAGSVEGTMHRIQLPGAVWTKNAWYITGVRVDPGAPGLSSESVKQFGRAPQIRLIVQPITRNPDGTLKVYDIAAHLGFNFTMPDYDHPFQSGCFVKPKADIDAFKAIVADLVGMRDMLRSSVSTAGPLGVHPGLNPKNPKTATLTRNEMKALLERHLSNGRLAFMAITALSDVHDRAWVFLSMANVLPGIERSMPQGGFVPVHGPALDGHHFAQLFNAAANQHMVFPMPYPNNGTGSFTCVNAALPIPGPPIDERLGVSTAPLMNKVPATSEDERNNIKDIINKIVDPESSNSFNTDCVSCHTETRLGIDLLIGNSHIEEDIDKLLLPDSKWNVRGFGWSPRTGAPAQPTLSHRVGKETFKALEFINDRCLPRPNAACIP